MDLRTIEKSFRPRPSYATISSHLTPFWMPASILGVLKINIMSVDPLRGLNGLKKWPTMQWPSPPAILGPQNCLASLNTALWPGLPLLRLGFNDDELHPTSLHGRKSFTIDNLSSFNGLNTPIIYGLISKTGCFQQRNKISYSCSFIYRNEFLEMSNTMGGGHSVLTI